VTLVAASIFTKQRQPLMERWAREGGLPPVAGNVASNPLTTGPAETPAGLTLYGTRDDYRLVPDGELGAACLGDAAEAGGMVALDWDAREIVWSADWGGLIYTPAGFCFADGSLYVNDLLGCGIFQVGIEKRMGEPLARISHPYMNDLHGLERSSRGLLAASSGVDAIIEVGLDGGLLYEWWATDHGFTAGPAGVAHKNGRGREHRDQFYHTRYQSTHVNTAVFEDAAERFILALLFHQGQLVRIDRAKPAGLQDAEVLLDGLARPHGLERTGEGWILTSSAACELLFLDDSFRVTKRVRLDGGWLQDCTMLSNGGILLNDVDNHSLIEVGGGDWHVVRKWVYPKEWRIDEIMEIPRQLAPAFLVK
jgi:hypothetical protein